MAALRTLKETNSRLKKKYPKYDIKMYKGEEGTDDAGSFFFLDGESTIENIEPIFASDVREILWEEVIDHVGFAVTKYELDRSYRVDRFNKSHYGIYRRSYNR
jgi:hypothetical protein